ncbi:MAG TPA: hypothetical protein EYG58_02425 [Nitrospirales bacterium]|nr:hypothetical protein [Nitrospirales bacterium]
MEEQHWADELRDIIKVTKRAMDDHRHLETWARELPERLDSHLTAFYRDLSTIQDHAHALLDRLSVDPDVPPLNESSPRTSLLVRCPLAIEPFSLFGVPFHIAYL